MHIPLVLLFSALATIARTFHSRKAHSYLDIKIKLSLTDSPAFCNVDEHLPCSVPYAISVLRSPNHFDLLSIMMQDGGSLNYNHNRYSDSTVIRLTKAMKQSNEKVYLGLRFFDLPDIMQDYVIVDVSKVIEDGRKTKLEIAMENVRLGIHIAKELEMTHGLKFSHRKNEARMVTRNTSKCACIPKNCACCIMFNIPKIELRDIGCVNVTYISEDIGVRLSFSVNGNVFVSKELSIRNPPPYCFGVPHLKEYAEICLRLRELELRQHHLDGCLQLDAELYHVHVGSVHVGCFSMPLQ